MMNYQVCIKRENVWVPLHGYAPADEATCLARRHYYMTTWQQFQYKVFRVDQPIR